MDNAGANSYGRSLPDSCAYPKLDYLHDVKTVCEEADAATRRQPGSTAYLPPRRWKASEGAEREDRDAAVDLARKAGLNAEDAYVLVDSLWAVGATPTELSVDPLLVGLRIAEEDRKLLSERMGGLIAASAEQTMRSLLITYASVERQYHQAPAASRGEWALSSELIPELASPLHALGTESGDFAAVKLKCELSNMCGRPLDGYEGTLWQRVNGRALVGTGTAIRILAEEYRELGGDAQTPRRMVLPGENAGKKATAEEATKETPKTAERKNPSRSDTQRQAGA